MPVRSKGRKLLIASIGVATVSYVACTGSNPAVSGNPVPPFLQDSGVDSPAESSANDDARATSGNLVAPIPDASDSGDAGAGDAPSDAPADVKDGG